MDNKEIGCEVVKWAQPVQQAGPFEHYNWTFGLYECRFLPSRHGQTNIRDNYKGLLTN